MRLRSVWRLPRTSAASMLWTICERAVGSFRPTIALIATKPIRGEGLSRHEYPRLRAGGRPTRRHRARTRRQWRDYQRADLKRARERAEPEAQSRLARGRGCIGGR